MSSWHTCALAALLLGPKLVPNNSFKPTAGVGQLTNQPSRAGGGLIQVLAANMQIELRGKIYSHELNEPELPEEPHCCCVMMYADIGPKGSEGADNFHFSVVTPNFLALHPETRWGTGYLLVPEFSWPAVERMVQRMVSSTSAPTWQEAAQKLCRYMSWEFDNYQPHESP